MKKGFTLIELLVVIGILAVLATLVVLVLNPAELFKQARDSQRLADLATVSKAVTYYLGTAPSPAIAAAGPFMTVASGACGFTSCTANTVTTVTGAGWVGINLASSTGGSPIARLPIDPTNNTTYDYSYKGSTTNLTFELDAVLESTKYSGMMANTSDGGDNASFYEVGSALNL